MQQNLKRIGKIFLQATPHLPNISSNLVDFWLLGIY